MDDTVLFLSAYNSTQYKATNWFLRKLRNVIPHKEADAILTGKASSFFRGNRRDYYFC
ncbi:MAG: hypothetical protein ACLRUL_10775 [Clostridia bacterium]